jgi:hypothetical protein
LKEEFVEISHTEQEESVGILLLGVMVLLHHGGESHEVGVEPGRERGKEKDGSGNDFFCEKNDSIGS